MFSLHRKTQIREALPEPPSYHPPESLLPSLDLTSRPDAFFALSPKS